MPLTAATLDRLDAATHRHLGEPVTLADATTLHAIINMVDDVVFGGRAKVGQMAMRYPASAAVLAAGDTITARGQAYTLTESPRRIGSGTEMEVLIREAD